MSAKVPYSINIVCDRDALHSSGVQRPVVLGFTKDGSVWRPDAVYVDGNGVLRMKPMMRGEEVFSLTARRWVTTPDREPPVVWLDEQGNEVDPTDGARVSLSLRCTVSKCANNVRIDGEKLAMGLERLCSLELTEMTLTQVAHLACI